MAMPPLHLDSSAAASYDFADLHGRGLAHRTVLVEAGSEGDLTTWLEHDALIELWPHLSCPAR